MRISRTLERKDAVDKRLDRACGEQRPDVRFEVATDGALFFDAPRPKRRSGERRAALHQRCQVDLGLVASLEPDLHEAAVLREALDVAAKVVAADDVEDDVHTLTVGQRSDGLDEIRCPVLIARAPSRSHAAHFSSDPAVANAVAPNAHASWIAVVPMPLVPP